MTQLLLFPIDEYQNHRPHRSTDGKPTCLRCRHRQRWEMGSMVISYCGIRQSRRTQNGLLKIKCRQQACDRFESLIHSRGPMWEADVYHYTAEESAEIAARQHRETDAAIAERMNRTKDGIRSKRRRLSRKGGRQ